MLTLHKLQISQPPELFLWLESASISTQSLSTIKLALSQALSSSRAPHLSRQSVSTHKYLYSPSFSAFSSFGLLPIYSDENHRHHVGSCRAHDNRLAFAFLVTRQRPAQALPPLPVLGRFLPDISCWRTQLEWPQNSLPAWRLPP